MDIPTFWRLIETTQVAGDEDIKQQTRLLIQELVELVPEEIIQFDMLLHKFHTQVYTNDLWAAANILMGGCSSDGFDYFRGWLLAQGEAIFHAALHNPESLADVIGKPCYPNVFVTSCRWPLLKRLQPSRDERRRPIYSAAAA